MWFNVFVLTLYLLGQADKCAAFACFHSTTNSNIPVWEITIATFPSLSNFPTTLVVGKSLGTMISQSIGFSANCIGLDLLGSDSFGMGKVEGFVSLNGLWFRLDWMGLHWVWASGLWIPYWIGFDFETFWDWLFDAHLSSGKWITLL